MRLNGSFGKLTKFKGFGLTLSLTFCLLTVLLTVKSNVYFFFFAYHNRFSSTACSLRFFVVCDCVQSLII